MLDISTDTRIITTIYNVATPVLFCIGGGGPATELIPPIDCIWLKRNGFKTTNCREKLSSQVPTTTRVFMIVGALCMFSTKAILFIQLFSVGFR